MIRRTWLLLLALLAIAWAPGAGADDFRPAYLQLTQVDATTYDVMWKLPARDEGTVLAVRPRFPAGTRELTPPRDVFASSTVVRRWRVSVAGGLEGKAIAFDGLATSRIDVLVRYARLDGSEQVGRVLPLSPRFSIRARPGGFEVARTYSFIGVEHILLGFDHLLFVLALVMIVQGRRRLLVTITAFTLAHSITLSLATLGLLSVPGPPVEAVIALSIMFVAAEILQQRQGRPGLASRKPWLVAFAFGLLHGLGFAGALATVGLPTMSVPLALLFFNIGVEIGQVLFIAVVLIALAALRTWAPTRASLAQGTPGCVYLIGGIASYWLLERISGFAG